MHLTEEEFAAMQQRVRGVASKDRTVSPSRRTSGSLRRPSPAYRSKLEAAYSRQLALEKQAGSIRDWRYEPMSLHLARGKRYRPDFMVWTLNREIELIEVKGKWFKNRRDSMTHLKWAAQLYPMYTWRLVQWNGHGFSGEYAVI